ncbi:MAG: ribosome maturation factor RimP [Deltaproteobacteria bacterium]|nr:ribosome maturation factor RimP [Deltaproteobacteria bacterium]
MSLTKQGYQKLIALSQNVCQELGLEHIETSLKKQDGQQKIVLVLDKPGGIMIDDCVKVSKRLSELLDLEDIIPFEYHLEVSSAGIFRELKGQKDFERFMGHQVLISLKNPFQGKKRWIGFLKGFEDPMILVEQADEVFKFNQNQVKKIRLHPDL